MNSTPTSDAIRHDWLLAARMIDHTLLKPEATRAQLTNLCREAADYSFSSVCVNPANVALCHSELRGSGIAVCAVIGFPLGATTTTVKLAEAIEALTLGAAELDMVLNIGALKSADHAVDPQEMNLREMVQNEIESLARLCHEHGARLKVILETALLTTAEKVLACELAIAAQADFVKTSTGFAASGATVDDVRLMRSLVGQRMGVKAAGGIRTARDLLDMVEAGASRIGCSASVAIVQELGAKQQGSN